MNGFIEIHHIYKFFYPPLPLQNLFRLRNVKEPAHTTALSDISFTVKKGSIVAILGPNGAGKTTLLHILATLLLPDSGTLEISGFSLGKENEKIRSCIGFMPDEERGLYPRLTGKQNIEFFGSLYDVDSRIIQERMKSLCELLKVDYARKRFGSYSTGMKKRFLLIKALIHNPSVLLLDEPTKGFDYQSLRDLTGFLKDGLVSKQGKTLIFSTHCVDYASDIADVLIIMHKGKIKAADTMKGLRATAGGTQKTIGDIFLRLTRDNDAF